MNSLFNYLQESSDLINLFCPLIRPLYLPLGLTFVYQLISLLCKCFDCPPVQLIKAPPSLNRPFTPSTNHLLQINRDNGFHNSAFYAQNKQLDGTQESGVPTI